MARRLVDAAAPLKRGITWTTGDGKDVRIERDTFGPIEVPADRLWGAQTQRSIGNFDISGERMPIEIVRALVQIKRASAIVNRSLGTLDATKSDAIVAAADEVLDGKHPDEFPLLVWQTGSGTQTNMNVNEVIANRASELMGGPRGDARLVHPNDDVNRSQSSNDVFPTAMNVAAADAIAHRLLPSLDVLRGTLAAKADAFARHRQDRPHAPAGRDAADARPGVFGLGRAARSQPPPPRARRSVTCASSRSAAPRSAPVSTRRRAMPSRSPPSSRG